jgi:hypothetical protein
MPQCVGLSCRFSGRATIRGELALKRKHIIAAKARENQACGQGGVLLLENSPKAFAPIDTRAEVAKIAGVSDNTIARVHESGRCTLPFRTFWRILQKSTLSRCMSRAAAPFPLGAETSRAGRLEGGPGFFRDGRHVSGWGPESGRAARAVRGRCGRLRATYTRSRDALPGSTGNGFVSGALLPLVASRAVCVGRIYSGLWRNYG